MHVLYIPTFFNMLCIAIDKDYFEEMEGWDIRSNIAERSHDIPTVESNSRLLCENTSVCTNGNNIPEQSHDLPKVNSDSTCIGTATLVYTKGNKTPEQSYDPSVVQSDSTWFGEATSIHTKGNKTSEQSYDPSVVQSDSTLFGKATPIYTKGNKTSEQSFDSSVVQSDSTLFGKATPIYTKGNKTSEQSYDPSVFQSDSTLFGKATPIYTKGNKTSEQSYDPSLVQSDSTWFGEATSIYTKGNKTPQQSYDPSVVQSDTTWFGEATSIYTKGNKTPEQSYDPAEVQSDSTWFGEATSIYTKGDKTPEKSYDPSVVQSGSTWFGEATSIYTKGKETPEQSYDPPKIQSDSTCFDKARISDSTKQNGTPKLHDVKRDLILPDEPFTKDKYLQNITKQYGIPEHSAFSTVYTALSEYNGLPQTNIAGIKMSQSKEDFKIPLVKKVHLNTKVKVYTDKKANLPMNFQRITKGFGIIATIIVFGIIATWICLLVTLFEILMLKSDVSTLQNQLVTFTSIQKIINTSIAQLSQNYSGFEQSSSKFDETVNSQFSFQYQRYPTQSCLEILKNNSSSPSGYYWVKSSSGNFIHVYCDMTRSCGGVIGGWIRVTKLNMEDSATSECPRGLVPNKFGSIHSCVSKYDGPSCSSVYFPVNDITYSKVCGTIRSYQLGTPDAFWKLKRGNHITIDSNYVDGISLTYGVNPRKHIWTLAAGPCPCNRDKPDFVSGNLFCDGVPHSQCSGICSDVMLWDGFGCTTQTTPWFYRDLQTYITEEIEMRVCHDESRTDEDIPIQLIELYIQ